MSEESERERELRLEGLLREVQASEPRKAFRDALRTDFVSGDLSTNAPSSSLQGHGGRSASGVIEDILLTQPSPRPARESFRKELRERFVRGELRPSMPAPLASEASSAGRPVGPVLRLVFGGAVAAAALWLIALLVIPDREPWRVLRIEGTGPVVVDGRELETRDYSEVGAAFAGAEVFSSGDNLIELVRDGDLVLRIQPGAQVEVQSVSEDGQLRLGLLAGEVYLKSREPYPGPDVLVETTNMEMRMVGTVVGVLVDSELTCVCVARGEVEVLPKAAGASEPGVCIADMRDVIFKDGKVQRDAFAELPQQGGAHVGDLRSFAADDDF